MNKMHWKILDVILENPGVSMRELAAVLGRSSVGSLHKYLPALGNAGFVTWDRYKARTLRGYGRIVKNKCVTGYICKRNGELYWSEGA